MNPTTTFNSKGIRFGLLFIAAITLTTAFVAAPHQAYADDGGYDFTVGGGTSGYDFTVGSQGYDFNVGNGGSNFIVGNEDGVAASGGCGNCSNGYDFTVSPQQGYDFTVNGQQGYDFTVPSSQGYDFTVAPQQGYDFTVAPQQGYDFTVSPQQGYDFTVGNTTPGYDFTVAGSPTYTTGGSTYTTGGYTYNTGGYVPGGYYGGGYYGGGYIGGGYYGAGGGYVITNPTTIIQPPQPHNCPTGYILSGNQCIPQVVNCPTGYTKDANGQCVPPIVNCPTGYTKDANGQCVPPIVNCPTGYTKDANGQCVPPVVQCPSGYTQTSNGCVPPNGTCPSGWTLQNNVCIPPTIYPPYNPYPYNPYPYNQYPYYYNNYYGNYATPTCNIYISHQYAAYGTPVTISWSSQYASGGTITYVGPVAPSGSMTVYPTEARTYVGTFNGYNGQTVTCSATLGGSGSTPYVSLSSVPYTGLDLGPVGTVLYWAFLILWCLWMSYLVTVKKIHKTATARVKNVLFGAPLPQKNAASHTTSHTAHAVPAHTTPVAPVAPAAQAPASHTDEFILSQIHRTKK